MRLISICGCLVTAGSLLLLAGCAQTYKMKGAEKEASVVNLDSCQADPDTVRVRKDNNVSWNVSQTDPHTYTIQFKRAPIPESNVRVSANAPDKPHKAKGDFRCNYFGSCLYAYTLTKEDGAACPDPGVRVIP